MNTKIKWGILGYAGIARKNVLPEMKNASNAVFYAIASRDPAKLEECRKAYNPSRLYNSYDGLLNDPDVEAVYIPLPNHMHMEWSVKAMRKGKHVLCEKPIALNTAECRAMLDESRKNGVKLMEAFMYRYSDRTRKLKALLESQVIGEIKAIRSCFRFLLDRPADYRLKPEMGGGSLYDVGCYPVNFISMVLGKEPVSMDAACVKHNGVDTGFAAVLKYPGDVLCTIESGFNSSFRAVSEVIGTKGLIEVPDTFMGSKGFITVTSGGGVRKIPVKRSARYRLEIEDFSGAIIQNREPLLNMDESLRNIGTIEQLMKKAADI
jgi:D-xylose 1-dehydrogenase (NADP+, D-xylono-1,5-lactone-forming)